MNIDALRDLSYGMFIVSSSFNNEDAGCVVNTVTQITSVNPTIAISINKDNYKNKIIKESKRLAISILSTDTDIKTISQFGYKSSKDINKFIDINYEIINDLKIVNDNICSYIIGDVVNIINVDTHDIFIIRVVDMKKVSDKIPMTYKYYQDNLKGKSPKNAPTYVNEYNKEGHSRYKCIICGYIYDDEVEEVKFSDLPDNWKCPVCGVGKDKFIKV